MKRKHSRYLIIIILLIGMYPLMSIFTSNTSLMVKTTKYKVSDTIGSYYTKNAYIESLGANRYRFSTKLGMENVYDGSNYVPYIYNPLDYSVQFTNSKLTFYSWYAVLEQDGEIRIDDLRWIVQRYTNKWNELDLWNHEFFTPVLTDKYMDFIMGYNDGLNFMNITYRISNIAGVKITIDFLSGSENIIRFKWQLAGLEGNFNYNATNRVFQFDDITISLNDTEPNKEITYDWEVANKKLSAYIENYSVSIGSKIFIDPTFSGKMETDADDFSVFELNSDIGATPYTAWDTNRINSDLATQNNYSFGTTFETSITADIENITNAVLTTYCSVEASVDGDYIGIWLYRDTTAGTDGHWNETEVDTGVNDLEFAKLENNGSGEILYENLTFWDANSGNGVNMTNNVNAMLNVWALTHNDHNETFTAIPLKFMRGNKWNGSTTNYYRESTWGTVSQRPSLTFDYDIISGEPPTTTTTTIMTTTTTTTTTTTPSNITAESFTDEFFLIHFLNNLALYLVLYWFVILAVTAVIIIIIKILYF